jgi:hypothetical protein
MKIKIEEKRWYKGISSDISQVINHTSIANAALIFGTVWQGFQTKIVIHLVHKTRNKSKLPDYGKHSNNENHIHSYGV